MGATADQIADGLIAPLDALWGNTAPKGMTKTAFRAGRARLQQDLRYLDPDQISVIAHEAEVMSQIYGAWPVPGLIMRRAETLFPNPQSAEAIRTSIERTMRAPVGFDALNADYAVEMLAELRTRGPRAVGATVMKINVERWKDLAAKRRRRKSDAEARGDAAALRGLIAAEQEAEAMVRAAHALPAPPRSLSSPPEAQLEI